MYIYIYTYTYIYVYVCVMREICCANAGVAQVVCDNANGCSRRLAYVETRCMRVNECTKTNKFIIIRTALFDSCNWMLMVLCSFCLHTYVSKADPMPRLATCIWGPMWDRAPSAPRYDRPTPLATRRSASPRSQRYRSARPRMKIQRFFLIILQYVRTQHVY